MRISNFFLGCVWVLLLCLSTSRTALGQTPCSAVVNTTNVTCPGGKDGTVEIIPYGPNGPSSGLCRAPIPAPYTCSTIGCTRSITTNADFTLNDGEVVCVQVANFNKNITFNGGGHLVFCGTAAPLNMNFNGNILMCKISVLTGANVTFSGFNNVGNSLLQNYGTITINGTGYNGVLENNGIININNNANINATKGDFTNNGTITVQGSFNIYNTLENYGTITVSQDVNVNSGSSFRNYCTLSVTGNLLISPSNDPADPNAVDNYGKITIGNQTTINGNALINLYNRSFWQTKNLMINGPIVGPQSPGCALLNVTSAGQITLNSGGQFSGAVSLCYPSNVTKSGAIPTSNCACTVTDPPTITWTTPVTVLTRTKYVGLAAGNYSVKVKIPGCNFGSTGDLLTKNFTITQPAPIVITESFEEALATVTATGGTGPYTYLWADGVTGQKHVLANKQSMLVNVTDSKGCKASKLITNNGGSGCGTITLTPTHIGCDGSTTGKIDVNVTGITDYKLYLNNNVVTSPITNLPAGNYTVVLKKDGVCETSASTTINVVANAMKIDIVPLGDQAYVVVYNGAPAYTYLWNDGNTSAIRLIERGKLYTVQVTDATGCKATKSIVRSYPDCLKEIYIIKQEVKCGDNTAVASAEVVAIGGSGNYSYLWTYNNATTAKITGMPAGTYEVRVTDNAKPICKVFASVEINYTGSSIVATHSMINGNQVKVVASGGTAPYSYQWKHGPTGDQIALPSYGTYEVTITDSKGCSTKYTVNFTEICKGFSAKPIVEGNKATIVATGGVPPYSYKWSHSLNEKKNIVSALPVGTYTVTVKDHSKDSCEYTVTFKIPDCEKSITFSAINASCPEEGRCSGTATVNVSPTTNLTYLWSNGQSTASATSLCAGTQWVQVSDGVCSVKKEIVINALTTCTGGPICNYSLSLAKVKNLSCYEKHDAYVDVKINGTPYGHLTLKWKYPDGSVHETPDEDLSGVAPGHYVLTAKDGLSCERQLPVDISGATARLSSSVSGGQIQCYGGTANVTVLPTGGLGPYSITWIGNSSTSFTRTLLAGSYPYVVKDANGCTVPGTATLSQVVPEIPKIFPASYAICTDVSPVKPVTLVAQSLSGYSYQWTKVGDPSFSASGTSISVLQPGKYTVTLSRSGCSNLSNSQSIAADTCNAPPVECGYIPIIDETIPDNPCDQRLKVAYGNARNHYRSYIEYEKTQFKEKYIEKCLASLNEQLTLEFATKEYHYTLYYYDQAGNLVRTVPPAGVKPLSATEIGAVKTEKNSGTKATFTTHTLESTYQYNTLGAQINADIPDHMRQPIWEVHNSNGGLPATANIEASYMSDNANGFLISNEGAAGFIYTSADGGEQWQKLSSVGVPDLYDVQWINTTQALAVGSEGVFLETSNSGVTWKYRFVPGSRELRKVAYNTTGNRGYIFDDKGNYYVISYTSPNWNIGAVNTGLATTMAGATLKDVHIVDANKIYIVTLESNNTSKIYFNGAGGSGSWTPLNSITIPPTSAVAASVSQIATVASIAGNNYLQVSNDAGATWKFLSTDVSFGASASKLVYEGASNVSIVAGGSLYRYKVSDTYNLQSQTPFTSPVTTVDIAYVGTSLWALGSNGSVVKADSYANTWAAVSIPAGNVVSAPVGMNFSKTIGVIYGNKIITTENGGSSWNDLSSTVIAGSSNTITTAVTYAYFTTKDLGVIVTNGSLYRRVYNNDLSRYEWDKLQDNVKQVAFDPVSYQLGCLVNSSGQLYTTDDGGQAWNILSSLLVPNGTAAGTTNLIPQIQKLAYANKKIYITLSSSGILVGSSTGWVSKTGNVTIPVLTGIDVSVTNVGYVSGNNGTILKTTNAGTSWQILPNRIMNNLNDVAQHSTHYFVADQTGVIYSSVHSAFPSNLNTISGNAAELAISGTQMAAVSNTGYILSQTAPAAIPAFASPTGNTFTIRSISLNTTSPSALVLIVGNNGAIYTATVGSSTTPVFRGINMLELLNDATMQSGSSVAYVVGNKGTLVKSADGGVTWRTQTINTVLNPIPDLTAVSSESNYAVAVGKSGFVIETNNGSSPWQPQTVSGTGVTSNLNDVATLKGVSLAVGESSSVFRKNGSAASWAKLSIATSILPANTSLTAVAFSDFTWAFVAGANGTLLRSQNINAATPTWTKLEKSVGVNWTTATITALYFKDRLTGYAFCNNGTVLKTTDGGNIWLLDPNKSLSIASAINSVATRPGSDELLVAGASGSNIHLLDQSDLVSTRYWYDEMGRLVVSQNAKQFIKKSYSYTIYDAQNRAIESGEVKMSQESLIDRPSFAKDKALILYATYKDVWLPLGIKSQITHTYYNEAPITVPGFTQENLRKRIATITYQESPSGSYDHATHYSYDAHGMVKKLLQDNPSLESSGRRYILFEYDYDLVSGKVNKLAYQPGQMDAFYHKYQYDADNRVTVVETSRDGVHWVKDAKYVYYAHGPLARTIIGADTVQTMDYAYTLQGWIKSMNAAQFSYALGYYKTDYKPVGTSNGAIGAQVAVAKPLYNGNITAMSTQTVTSLPTWNNNPINQQFEYDQLHRLMSTNVAGGGNNYRTSYAYDANGNIRSLNRYNEAGTQFDALSYQYQETSNLSTSARYPRNTNKLLWVDDNISYNSILSEDIDDQIAENYKYDSIGQLVLDQKEFIDTIEWNVYHKIKRIIRKKGNNLPDLEFEYDALGHRIEKTIKGKVSGVVVPSEIETTYYVRDASGKTISTYLKKGLPLILKEQHMYGLSRVGISQYDIDVSNTLPEISQQRIGLKEYEITDYLGNVNLVLSDHRPGLNQGEVLSANDYYAFGMMMPKRKFNSNTYRYGYNGMEIDNEVQQGVGNSYTTEFRQYDARLGRWLSLDPKMRKFPYLSGYNAYFNNPILWTDVDGGEPRDYKADYVSNLAPTMYKYFRQEGFSPQGTLFLIAQAANESDYATRNNFSKTHNLFGTMSNGKLLVIPSVEKALESQIELLEERWPKSIPLLKEDSDPTNDEIDKALRSGKYKKEGMVYNNDKNECYTCPIRKNFETYIRSGLGVNIDEIISTFNSLSDVSKKIDELRDKRNNLIDELIGGLNGKENEANILNQIDGLGNQINELIPQVESLKSRLNELEKPLTGESEEK